MYVCIQLVFEILMGKIFQIQNQQFSIFEVIKLSFDYFGLTVNLKG